MIITFKIIIYNEEKYYKKTNWNVLRQEFYDNYYPSIKEFFTLNFSNDDLELEEEIDDMYYYKLDIPADIYLLNIRIESHNDMCKFSLRFNLFYDDVFNEYEKLYFFDDVMTKFATSSFYDYKITNGIVSDIFNTSKNNDSYVYYFDNAVGNLGCHYAFIENKNNAFDNYNYDSLLFIEIDSLLRDSDSYIERLKSI